MEMITPIKKHIIIITLLLPIIIGGCSRSNVGITLDYNINKMDVGKISFFPSDNKKGLYDMTSAIDSLFCKGDTLFISYKTNTDDRWIDTARDGSLIYSGVRTKKNIVDTDRFTQLIQVPQNTKYIFLDNHDYCFFFIEKKTRKYQLIEYHLVDSTAQNKIQWHLGSQDSIKRDDTVRPSSKLRPDPTDGINRK